MGEVLNRPPRLPRVGWVDSVGLEGHAAALTGLEVEGQSRVAALEFALRLLEVCVPERTATPGHVREVCARAARHRVAAVRVRPDLVAECRDRLTGTGVRVVAPGGDEATVALDVGAMLAGCYADVVEEIAGAKDGAGSAPLTVVVGVDEVGCYEDVRRATLLAIAAGADFVEVSSVSPPDALCVLETIRDAGEQTGRLVGFKASGCDDVEDAIHLLVLVHETLGPAWLTAERCRLAGTRLLEELGSAIEQAD